MVLWTLPSMAVQAVLVALEGPAKERFPRIYWRGIGLILGLQLRVIGAPATVRPVLFIANHSSWVDIVAFGAVLPGCFIAKGDIKNWPMIGWIAKLGRTMFVSRARDTVAHEQREIERRLVAGDNIILFPEGTTSNGNCVLPFASAFLTLAFCKAAPAVQPVTIVYDRLDGLPMWRENRAEIAWFGDMNLAPHFLRLARHRHFRATILFGRVVPSGAYANRKTLTAALEQEIAATAAALRQGRLPA